MSELQWALAATGAVCVAAVWAYNRYQESKSRRSAEQAFGGAGGDVLETAAGSDTPTERREPVIDTGTPLPPLPEAWADEMADCIVRIDFTEPLAAGVIWQAQAALADRLQRPTYWLGLDAILNHWRPLGATDAGRYAVICASMQLADRRGPASGAEIAAFLDGINDLLRQYPGRAELPSADDVEMHARAVDDACMSVDMQLALNIVPASGRPFDGAAFRHAIEQAGFLLGDDGCFRSAEDLFCIGRLGGGAFDEFADNALEQGATLILDVPRVADGVQAFDRLLALVGELGNRFDSALVDAQRNALAVEAIDAIRSKIADLQGQMGQRRIAPGSVRARRLFS